MKLTKIIYSLAVVAFVGILLSACSGDEIDGNAALTFKADLNDISNVLESTDEGGLIINRFVVNIDEIELEGDDGDDDDYKSYKYSDVKLRGPFVMELVSNGRVNPQLFNGLEIPAGRYEEIEFDIEKNKNKNSEMYGKSVLIEGSIAGTPFVFWHDEDEDFEIEFDDDEIWIDADSFKEIVLVFRLHKLFNKSKGVSLSNAKDGNGDGIIEIYPGDPDGNSSLADKIWDLFEDALDALDD